MSLFNLVYIRVKDISPTDLPACLANQIPFYVQASIATARLLALTASRSLLHLGL